MFTIDHKNGRQAVSIVREPFAWPGGYERFAITDDGGTLCHQCVKKELPTIAWAIPGAGWLIIATSHTGENDSEITCDHCGRMIRPAWDAPTTEVLAITVHHGIAGQMIATADVRTGDEGPRTVTFVGTQYGTPGPVYMHVGPGQDVRVDDPSRFGDHFNEAWVRAFFTEGR